MSYYEKLFEDRKQFLNNLRDFIKTTENRQPDLPPVSISINAPWGYGKSFFIEALKEQLEDHNYILEYNAWECDFEEDVLMSITNELASQMQVERSQSEEFADKFTAATLGLAKSLLNNIPAKGISICNTVKDYKAEYKEISKELNPQLGLQNDSNSKKLLQQFSTLLEFFRTNMAVTENNAGMKDNYVIVVIDELDRCTPNYAISVLERIKHFFSVPGYFFIFMLNNDQTQQSLTHVFGNIDADNYLRRFFSMSFSLPEPDYDSFFDEQFPKSIYGECMAAEVMKRMIKEKSDIISLRTIEKLASYLRYCLDSQLTKDYSPEDKVWSDFIIPFTIISKSLNLNMECNLKYSSWIDFNHSFKHTESSAFLENTILTSTNNELHLHLYDYQINKIQFKLLTQQQIQQNPILIHRSTNAAFTLSYSGLTIGEVNLKGYSYWPQNSQKLDFGILTPNLSRICNDCYNRLTYML